METVKNKVQLTGKLSQEPQTGETAKGRKWATFSIGITECFNMKNGEKRFETQWYRLKAWGKIAEQVESDCPKGTRITVTGKLKNRTYDDKEGKKRYITEVEVFDLNILEKYEADAHLK